MSDASLLEPAATHSAQSVAALTQAALDAKEGVLASNGALVVETGRRTGRSPQAKYIVSDGSTESAVDWGEVNRPMSEASFQQLWDEAEAYASTCTLYEGVHQVGADATYAVTVRVRTEYAWHQIVAKHLFIETPVAVDEPAWTLLSVPGFCLDPLKHDVVEDGAVVICFSEKKILLCGMRYAGEMKKSLFTVQNFLLPERGVLPMHCAANVGEKGDLALFFGLSGTGKTTLSADPERYLVGDDEHAWTPKGVFNLEGGCYAKCINLSQANEPLIWNAIKEGTVLENVCIDAESGEPDYTDVSLSQNSRAAYPLAYIPSRIKSGCGPRPSVVLFLTCDLYGVLPPVAALTREQAAYYFLSGYTALMGSTEVGSSAAIKPTFSTCFGAPFFPRPAHVYADLLLEHAQACQSKVYLVNTGWTGGAYGEGGERFSIPTTRAMVRAIMEDSLTLDAAPVAGFDLVVPSHIPGVDARVLRPEQCWQDKAAYKKSVNALVRQFKENFKRYSTASDAIKAAGPSLLE